VGLITVVLGGVAEDEPKLVVEVEVDEKVAGLSLSRRRGEISFV
jgi:hypothetical protein